MKLEMFEILVKRNSTCSAGKAGGKRSHSYGELLLHFIMKLQAGPEWISDLGRSALAVFRVAKLWEFSKGVNRN